MEEIVLVGGGGHCKSCIDVIEASGLFSIAGIVDIASKRGSSVAGYPIIGTDDDYANLLLKYQHFLITLGQLRTSELREKLFNTLITMEADFPVVISPTAYVSKSARIGSGTIIMHGAIINADAIVGKNCIINSNALIEHDAVVEDHCHIATAAVVNGGVAIGHSSFVGSGVVIKQYTTVPDESFIKALTLYK